MGLRMTGKVGPGDGVKTSRLIVSRVVLPRSIEVRYWFYICGIGRLSWLAPECAAVCVRASYGPGPRLSLWASRGVRNVGLGESIRQANTSFSRF